MAKILVVAKKHSPSSWNFAKSLKNQGHEVVLLTSKDKSYEAKDNSIPTHFYFSKWSFTESVIYIPILFKENFQIVHFYLEDEDFGRAQLGLLSALALDQEVMISTSMMNMNLEFKRFSPLKWLLERSDLVTTSTLEMMASLRGLNIQNREQTRGLLPPLLDLQFPPKRSEEISDLNLFDAELLKSKPFLLIPAELDFKMERGYLQELSELGQKYALVFCWTENDLSSLYKKQLEEKLTQFLGGHWIFHFNSTEERILALAAKSDGIVLAGQNFRPVEFSKWVRWAFLSESVPFIDDEQSKMYSALWEHGQNCFIFRRYHLQKDYHQWIANPTSIPRQEVRSKILDKKEVFDAPLNQLQRLYLKALHRKSIV